MLETFREHSQRQGFRLRHRFVSRLAAGKNTGELGNFCDQVKGVNQITGRWAAVGCEKPSWLEVL